MTRDIKKDVSINHDQLDSELTELPSLLWHYGELEAVAHTEALRKKADSDQAHASAYKRLKSLARKEKATEAQVSAEVELDPEYIRYVSKWIDAEGNARRLKAVVESLRAKRDALVQLGANHRQQVSAGLDHIKR